MSTILSPVLCHDCHELVHVVRRTVVERCQCSRWEVPFGELPRPTWPRWECPDQDTHAIPDVAWTVVDSDGERHRCPEVAVA